MCKVRDGYTCQICGFCPGKAYKGIGVPGAVEAHHTKLLSRLAKNTKEVITTPKDLVTVCRNCHAALHAKDVNGSVRKVRKALGRIYAAR
jgi:predicted HNH restriction endonuclease